MARVPDPDDDTEPDDAHSLPDDAAHIVVVGQSYGAPAPEGYPEADFLTYEQGDELPFDVGAPAVSRHPSTLAALDEDGTVVAGGQPDPNPLAMAPAGDDVPSSHDARLEDALEGWRTGEGFDPSDYTADGAE